MVANDIIEYFLQHYQAMLGIPQTTACCASIIESWVCADVGNKVIVRGQIHSHPKYQPGKQLKTSPVQGYFSGNGHVYINTKNSIYQLGLPRQDFAGDPQILLEEPQWEKLTYWEE